MLAKAAHWVERFVFPLIGVVHKVGLGILLAMMFLTVGDVFGRYFFTFPIPGSFEVTTFMLALLVFFTVGYTQIQKGHISIDVVVSRFSARAQATTDSIVYLVSLGLVSIVTWQLAVHAKRLWLGQNVSGILLWPYYPFVIAVAFGSLLFCLVLVVDLLTSFAKVVKHES